MEKTIILNGEKVVYVLNIKKVINLNVRIKSDGKVYVSANEKCSIDSIERFLKNNATFILKAIKKYNDKPKLNYDNGDKLFVFGKLITLQLLKGENNLRLLNDILILSVKDTNNLELKKKGLDTFYKRKTEQALEKLIKGVYLQFKQKYNVVYPKIKITKLTSAWGNCRKHKNEIHFSIYLSKLDMYSIKYVIIHEMAHLIQDNHSAKFYKIVREFMPDYLQVRKNLKKY